MNIQSCKEFASIEMSAEERVLLDRYTRTPRVLGEMAFEFTRDQGYLHQYFRLREPGASGLSADQEETYDRASHILIGRRGNQVLAGCRLTISTPRKLVRLPMEEGGANLWETLDHVGLEYRKYAELSAIALDSAEMEDAYMQPLLRHVCRKLAVYNVDYLLGRIALSSTATYRRNFWAMGLQMNLDYHAPLPALPNEEVRSYLMLIDVSCLGDAATLRGAAQLETALDS